MESKIIAVHCSFSEEKKDIAQIIRDSFKSYLQKELRTFAKGETDRIS